MVISPMNAQINVHEQNGYGLYYFLLNLVSTPPPMTYAVSDARILFSISGRKEPMANFLNVYHNLSMGETCF